MVGKEFPAFRSHFKRRLSPQERREELQGRATIPRVPLMSQSIPEKTVFPVLPLLPRRGSTTTTVARGTALWESLEGKPLGKASWESHRSLDPRDWQSDMLLQLGREATCMLPLETRTDSPGKTPEVPQDPCQHRRGILRFPPRLHTRS